MRSVRSKIAFGAVIGAALLVVVLSQVVGGGGSSQDGGTTSTITVKGYLGSEKNEFIQNPQVRQILADRYGLTVNFTSLGSIAQTTADTTGQDFLWPSNDVALVLYQDTHAGPVKSETVFRSPLVLYSWAEVTDVLIQQGIVTEENGVYYADMSKLVELAVLTDQTWQDIGLAGVSRQINIISTDPLESNSGNMFYGLLANLLAPGEVADDTTIEQVLPTLKTYYQSLGFLSRRSGDLFNDFINTGMGANPLIINYENLLIELTLQNPASRAQILQELRVIYPRPTVWANHPIIALTDNGARLMEALKDDEIQKIAWEQHGFRSGLIGVNNNPSVLQAITIPATIDDVIPLPRPSVMGRIIAALQQP